MLTKGNMIALIIIFAMVTIFLTACMSKRTIELGPSTTVETSAIPFENDGQTDLQESKESKKNQTDKFSLNSNGDDLLDGIPSIYLSVLDNERKIVLGEEYIYLKDYFLGFFSQYDDSSDYHTAEIAIVDLDADGVPELLVKVLRIGQLVLHVHDNEVYGSFLSVREMTDVKIDGSFLWSSSAALSGWSKIRFVNGTYESVEILKGDYENEQWFRGENIITEEEFRDLFDTQANKENIEWFEKELPLK